MRDARIRFEDLHPADSDFFRLEGCLCTPDEARETLRNAGYSAEETSEYLNSLPIETERTV